MQSNTCEIANCEFKNYVKKLFIYWNLSNDLKVNFNVYTMYQKDLYLNDIHSFFPLWSYSKCHWSICSTNRNDLILTMQNHNSIFLGPNYPTNFLSTFRISICKPSFSHLEMRIIARYFQCMAKFWQIVDRIRIFLA